MNPSITSQWSLPLRGIYPPMVTPLSGIDELDISGLTRLIEHLIAGGVHGIFILGTTGEGPSLSHRLRRELIERTCQQVDGRVPVLVGITDTSFVESIELAQHAADHGADFVVSSVPYYMPPTQQQLMQWVRLLAEASPLPVILYDIPAMTKTGFTLETLQRAMQLENVVGFKDSSANMIRFHHLIEMVSERPDWTILVGPEELLAEAVLMGGHGGVCGGACADPGLYVDLFQAATNFDIPEVRRLHRQVRENVKRHQPDNHPTTFIRELKHTLRNMQLCDDVVAAPFGANELLEC